MHGRAAIIGLAVAAFLAGCGGEGDEATTLPSVTDSPTSAATSTADATPTASTSMELDGDEAVALARNYYETVNAIAREGGGLERLSALVDSSCEACKRQIDRLQSVTSGGRRIVGGEIEIVETRLDSLIGGTALVLVTTRSDAGAIVDRLGTTVDTLPEGKLGDRVVTVAVTPDGLRVVAVQSLGDRQS